VSDPDRPAGWPAWLTEDHLLDADVLRLDQLRMPSKLPAWFARAVAKRTAELEAQRLRAVAVWPTSAGAAPEPVGAEPASAWAEPEPGTAPKLAPNITDRRGEPLPKGHPFARAMVMPGRARPPSGDRG
jgi:hypothetical protein